MMAITIQDQPAASTFYSVGNPIELLISSTLTASSNFKLSVDVYSPASTTLLANLKYDIVPSTTQVLADVHQILKSKINENITNLRTSATGVKNESLKHFTANVKATEYLGNPPALISSGITTSNTFSIFNGALKYLGWVKGDITKYRINSGAGADTLTQKFLTGFDNFAGVTEAAVIAAPATYFKGSFNARKLNAAQLAQSNWLWQGASGGNAVATMGAYKEDLTGLIQNTKSLTSVHALMSMNFGTAALIAGGWAALNSTFKYLHITLKTDSVQVAGVYLFEIDWSPCSRFDSYEIHWLNRYGGWDSWVFDKRTRKATEIDRRAFNPTSLPISGSGIVHNIYDIKGKNFVVSTKERYLVNSRYLKGWELTGLEDLITSPLVYWNSPDGFINIVVNNPTTFEHKTNTVDKLFNLQFEFEIDNQDIRQ
jgi:hypothetical protein